MERIRGIIKRIKPVDERFMQETQKRLDSLTKPIGSLGRLEEFAKRITGITRKNNPSLEKKVIFTFAADHGVAEEGVSAYPVEVTAQMVYNFLSGGAGINVLARHVGARVVVVDMGVAEKIKQPIRSMSTPKSKFENFKDRKINYGTGNMAKGPAMTKKEALSSILAGVEVFEEELEKNGIDIAGIGDMGIGNTTAVSAILAAITKARVKDVTGRGTGIDDTQLRNKIEVIKRALRVNRPDPTDPIDILAKVGGYEIGGLAGVVLVAAANKVPVVIDGFISTVSALVATQLAPLVKDYLFASHKSVEIGHNIALREMDQRPMFDLKMRLGEGTGAALAINIIEAGVKILNQMASFEEAGVSEKL
ncbi:MAG: nicotinate-nucleotide--dimethylbenzimidazole phosphoribosyltransferase [Candidatus Omnitrophica bacterium]|nr:nicotinate-nucleotide--dimethylbenzimidazole phosphoribosyltransferase [Candidatus Omnitrophota bacterium]